MMFPSPSLSFALIPTMEKVQLKKSLGETRTVGHVVLFSSVEGNERHLVTWNARTKSEYQPGDLFPIL